MNQSPHEGARNKTLESIVLSDFHPGSLAGVSNERRLTEEVKPTDTQCIRSELFIRSMLEGFALVLSNPSPDEVLDPVTAEDLRAFAIPGGLLSTTGPQAEHSIQPEQ